MSYFLSFKFPLFHLRVEELFKYLFINMLLPFYLFSTGWKQGGIRVEKGGIHPVSSFLGMFPPSFHPVNELIYLIVKALSKRGKVERKICTKTIIK